MRNIIKAFVAIAVVLFASGLVTQWTRGEAKKSVVATVESVTDGDTIRVDGDRRVRLLQIDTPEISGKGECYGLEAKRELERLLPVDTKVGMLGDPDLDKSDRYGRLLRYVRADRRLVQLEMVKRGAAAPYLYRGERGQYAGVLVSAARTAQRERRGAWGRCPQATLTPDRAWSTGARRPR